MGKVARERKSTEAARLDHASAARSRQRNGVPISGAEELAQWRPLWPHTASGFESYNRSKSIWWHRAIEWIRSERAFASVLAALMTRFQSTGGPSHIPVALQKPLLYFALYKLRYPICPGELQLEADRPERGPLCKEVCEKHHPEEESTARHKDRYWTRDPMERNMRRAWHNLPDQVRQPSIDRYNEVDRLRMGDGSQLKRLLEVDDPLDEELRANGTARYLGEWFSKDQSVGSQHTATTSSAVKQEKRTYSSMQPFHLPRQLFKTSDKPGPATQTASAGGNVLENNAVASAVPPVEPPRPHVRGSNSIPIGPRGWVEGNNTPTSPVDPVLQTMSAMLPPASPSPGLPWGTPPPSPPVIPGHKSLWVAPGPSPLSAGTKHLPGDPRAQVTKNRVVPVHNLSPVVSKDPSPGAMNDSGSVGLGLELYMEREDESETDLRAASDEIHVSALKPNPVDIPAELQSLKMPGNVPPMTEMLRHISDSLHTYEAKKVEWEGEKSALMARVARGQERSKKMDSDLARLRSERDLARVSKDQYKAQFLRAEASKVELEMKIRELEQKFAR